MRCKINKNETRYKIGITNIDSSVKITYKNYDGIEIDVSTDIGDVFDLKKCMVMKKKQKQRRDQRG